VTQKLLKRFSINYFVKKTPVLKELIDNLHLFTALRKSLKIVRVNVTVIGYIDTRLIGTKARKLR